MVADDWPLSERAVVLREAIVAAWLPGKTPMGLQQDSDYVRLRLIPSLRRDAERALIALAQQGALTE